MSYLAENWDSIMAILNMIGLLVIGSKKGK